MVKFCNAKTQLEVGKDTNIEHKKLTSPIYNVNRACFII